ncbi:uncharacterized protein LOC142162346 [Nicotiana tabacum]|uniref:Uncharacterized protein LOC142162346 n=1 Tax=Nicotiana tabacum TaxID=4097 RepID=A0AC58RPX4_TOBAC
MGCLDSRHYVTLAFLAKLKRLSPNDLKLFKKTCFGYLLSFPNLCMQNQDIHFLMKYELKSSDASYFTAELKGERLNFGLREFVVITGLRCHTEVTDFGYTPSYISKIMSSYFPNKVKVEKTCLKQIVTTKSWINYEDAVKLCILYLIEYFICPSEKDHIGLNPFVHSYLIRGFPLAMQVWLYECCSSVNIDIATKISNSIPRILNWSAAKGQIWLAAIEDKMINPEWMKFTNINESPEELSVMSLPDKVEYTIEEVEHVSENPKVDAPPLEPKESIAKEEKESILRKIKKLKRGIEKVDEKLEKFRKDLFEELGSLRDLIKDSVKAVLQVINNPNDQVDAKFAGSSTKNTNQPKDKNNQQFQFNSGETVQVSPSKIEHVECAHGEENHPARVDLYTHFEGTVDEENAEREDMHAQSPIHGVIVATQIEQQNLDDDNVGEKAEYVNVGDSEESEGEKKEVTLDDFELPDNFSHSGGSISVGPQIFHLKHPFTSVIGQNVDPELLDQFHKWLYNGTDTGPKRRKAPYSIKDNQIKPWLDLGVEKVDKKEWFFSLAHPGQVLNDSYINIIMYYLRKKGKYDPYNNTIFTTTDCVFKTRIDQIYEKFKNSPQEKKFSIVKLQDVVAEYILGYRLLTNVAWDEVDYVIMPINIVEKFHWVLVVFDIAERCLYAYDSMVSSHNHSIVESCADKFSIIILLYLSCTGFYGKRKNINFKNTKTYIEKPVTDLLNIQWIIGEIPQQKEGSLDCGVFVAAFAEYVSIGELSIPTEDFSDIDQHCRCYGALLWDYARKKQEIGAISDSEVTCKFARRKGAPTLNEKTRVQRKKK